MARLMDPCRPNCGSSCRQICFLRRVSARSPRTSPHEFEAGPNDSATSILDTPIVNGHFPSNRPALSRLQSHTSHVARVSTDSGNSALVKSMGRAKLPFGTGAHWSEPLLVRAFPRPSAFVDRDFADVSPIAQGQQPSFRRRNRRRRARG